MSKPIIDDRAAILGAIKQTLASMPRPKHPSIQSKPAHNQLDLDCFKQRLIDSLASYEETTNLSHVPKLVAALCQKDKLSTNIAVAAGKLAQLGWHDARLVTQRVWDDRLSLAVTGCRGAIAETGQFLVTNDTDDAWLSLVAPVHVVVIQAQDVYKSLNDLGDLLGQQPPAVATLVHGPSRTGDIEQTLVIGAHGPRQVHAIIVDKVK